MGGRSSEWNESAVDVEFSYECRTLKFASIGSVWEAESCKADEYLLRGILKGYKVLYSLACSVGVYLVCDILRSYTLQVLVTCFSASYALAVRAPFGKSLCCKFSDVAD